MKYLKTLSFRTKVFVGLLLVSLVGYGVYSYTWPIYVQWQKDHEVLVVKTEVERIETFGSQNRYVYYKTRDSVTPDVLSNHYVMKTAKLVGRESNQPVELSFDVYDLNHLENPPKTIDVVKLVQSYDESYKLDFQARRGYTDGGKDYIVLSLVNKENKEGKKEVALDVDSEQIVPALSTDKAESKRTPFSFDYTNLDKIATEYGFIPTYHLAYSNDSKVREDTNINFIRDYPEYYKGMEGAANIVVRKGAYYDPEAIFQDMRHWFAPVGQDKLDVVGIDPKTKEETPLNSYQEYQEWYEKHIK
ncbi:hypothetical protein FXF62_00040 [Streptococcus cristatus]|uniref:Uncharacterized protein n=1 Tax=Streptococcus cristatus TaxID=45634 RepID=A0A5B0DMC8_STRCR|nr:hypothetical protein [Streptococcus cristatus]KAA0967112.1 hypothetical protein FXF62_00040 [Streptococcus cristatus]